MIHACYSSTATGITDAKCKSGEKAIAWAVKGNQGNPGPAGPAGGSEIRAGFCVAGVPSGQAAGTIEKVCTFKQPLTDPCEYPVISAVIPA